MPPGKQLPTTRARTRDADSHKDHRSLAAEKLKQRFFEIDQSGDGKLDVTEMGRLLRQGDPNMANKQVRGLFKQADADRDGFVDFEEFVDFLYGAPNTSGQATSGVLVEAQQHELRDARITTQDLIADLKSLSEELEDLGCSNRAARQTRERLELLCDTCSFLRKGGALPKRLELPRNSFAPSCWKGSPHKYLGSWFTTKERPDGKEDRRAVFALCGICKGGKISVQKLPDLLQWAEPRVKGLTEKDDSEPGGWVCDTASAHRTLDVLKLETLATWASEALEDAIAFRRDLRQDLYERQYAEVYESRAPYLDALRDRRGPILCLLWKGLALQDLNLIMDATTQLEKLGCPLKGKVYHQSLQTMVSGEERCWASNHEAGLTSEAPDVIRSDVLVRYGQMSIMDAYCSLNCSIPRGKLDGTAEGSERERKVWEYLSKCSGVPVDLVWYDAGKPDLDMNLEPGSLPELVTQAREVDIPQDVPPANYPEKPPSDEEDDAAIAKLIAEKAESSIAAADFEETEDSMETAQEQEEAEPAGEDAVTAGG